MQGSLEAPPMVSIWPKETPSSTEPDIRESF